MRYAHAVIRRWMTIVVVAVVASAAVALPARAAISQLVVFGDSLSDNGNHFAANGSPPAPFYVNGRYSNGAVAVEVMASLLGLRLDDRAWGGATTGTDFVDGLVTVPSVATQVSRYLSGAGGRVDAGGLYVLWAGPNDLLNGIGVPGFDPLRAADAAVANLRAAYVALAAGGAQQFLVPLMPDLGITVRGRAGGSTPNAQFTAVASYFNAVMRGAFAGLSGVTVFDTFTLSDTIWKNPSLYGLTNVVDACVRIPTNVCTGGNGYFFWDDIHPSATVHSILGTAFAAAYRLAEPETITLVVLAMLLIAARRRNEIAWKKGKAGR